MRAIEEHGAGARLAGGLGDAHEAPDVLVDALKAMGLENLDPAAIAPEFRVPLIRLAPSWTAAISETTLSTRRSDLRRFSWWRLERSEAPFPSDTSLSDAMERHPADAGQTYSPGTIKRIGSNLASLARGVGSDCAEDTAQRCRNQSTRAAQKRERLRGVQRDKPYLTEAQMQGMRQAIAAEVPAFMLAVRDLAIFDAASDLLASRAEITRMRLRDLDLRESTIRFLGTRTDQADRGAVFAIAQRTVASIEAWLDASGLRDLDVEDPGSLPLFVGVMNGDIIRLDRRGIPEPMNGRTVARALQRYAAGLGISGVAGHSLRRSTARALHEAGVPEDEIVRKGRWSSLDQMREYVGFTAPIQGAMNAVFG